MAVDCGRGREWGIVCYEQGIRRWPDFRFFVNGESVDDWDGEQYEVQDFIDYVTTMMRKKDEL